MKQPEITCNPVTALENDDSRQEREITVSQSADNRDVWFCATNDPVWDRRLRKFGAEIIREHKAPDGNITMREYKLTGGMVRIRKQPEKRILSDAEREIRYANLQKARNAK